MTIKQRLWCVRVPKRSGEPVRSLLVGMGAFQRDAAVQRDGDYLYFPVKYEINITDQFPDVRLLQRDFECMEKQTFEDIIGFTPSYDMIGDIAIIDADDLDAELIADAIIRMHRNIKTVLGALSPVQGEFRVRDLRVIAGEPKTETVHKEYGCQYEIDLARVYFTQRLATERKRIADQVGGGDVVVDMFAGAGPFSILAAKSAKEVVAIDKNPVATLYLERNATLNRVSNMRIICGDAADVAYTHDLVHIADHVIMNLPHSADEFLDEALTILKPGGIIHYYDIREEDDLFDGAEATIKDAASARDMTVRVLDRRIVRSYSPHQYNIAMDVEVCGG
ncbi:MAG: class I SAM-dependent methyltransferase family protein [Euryarchaeota archaeon]|nr:class I SAM-dependent methyltransferase family protein [Euryarchaeota archaeon]